MVQVINFCLFSSDVLVIYLDECGTKVCDRINGCVFCDFINEWCDVFVDELCDLFIDYRSRWSRSTCEVLATMENAATMEDRLKDDAEAVWEYWHICSNGMCRK